MHGWYSLLAPVTHITMNDGDRVGRINLRLICTRLLARRQISVTAFWRYDSRHLCVWRTSWSVNMTILCDVSLMVAYNVQRRFFSGVLVIKSFASYAFWIKHYCVNFCVKGKWCWHSACEFYFVSFLPTFPTAANGARCGILLSVSLPACLSVCLFAGHSCQPCKNGWTNQNVV